MASDPEFVKFIAIRLTTRVALPLKMALGQALKKDQP